MESLIIELLAVVAIFIVGIIFLYVLEYVKTKTSKEQWEFIEQWVTIAVNGIESIVIDEKQGSAKKDFVIKYILSICENKGYDIDEETIEIMIENACQKLGFLSKKQEE